jgi:anti-sigma factor RsiW
MECSRAGVIRNEELLAYLAGEKVRPLVREHLAECRHCFARLTAYRRMDLALSGALYRWDCPRSEVLGEYQLGLLGQEGSAAVRHHLVLCELCAAEVAALVEFLASCDTVRPGNINASGAIRP